MIFPNTPEIDFPCYLPGSLVESQLSLIKIRSALVEENLKTYQKIMQIPRWQSMSMDWTEKHKLDRGRQVPTRIPWIILVKMVNMYGTVTLRQQLRLFSIF